MFKNLIGVKLNKQYVLPFKYGQMDICCPSKYPNLAPLKKDTISFKGSSDDKKVTDKAYYGGIGNIVRNTLADAEVPYQNFRKTMQDIFKNECVFEGNNPKNPIGTLVVNKKSENSLRHKCASKEISKASVLKEEIRDIIRARIVLDEDNSSKANAICNTLTKAVKQGKINIVNIKSYYEMDRKYSKGTDASYMSLNSLLKLDNEVMEKQGISVLQTGTKRDSGYHAVHVIFRLEDGFYGELQIMGDKVAKAKELEDIIYKIKGNKPISSDFSKVQEVYNEEIKGKPRKEKALVEYTRRAFNAERQKELSVYSGLEKEEFLPIPSDINIPEIFDFNNLAKILRK